MMSVCTAHGATAILLLLLFYEEMRAERVRKRTNLIVVKGNLLRGTQRVARPRLIAHT